jgi:hypothetical protein
VPIVKAPWALRRPAVCPPDSFVVLARRTFYSQLPTPRLAWISSARTLGARDVMPSTRKCVLFVDDEPSVLAGIRRQLHDRRGTVPPIREGVMR